MRDNKSLNLREIVVMASISIVFGVLYLLWIFLASVVKGIVGPAAAGLMNGMWVMAPVVCAYIIRKPGVALIAELIAAGTEVLVGSVNAGAVLLLGLTQGLGVELAFALVPLPSLPPAGFDVVGHARHGRKFRDDLLSVRHRAVVPGDRGPAIRRDADQRGHACRLGRQGDCRRVVPYGGIEQFCSRKTVPDAEVGTA